MDIDKPLAVEIEIEKEKAEALGRTGRKLESCVQKIREIEAGWRGSPDSLKRQKAYRLAVKRAYRYKYDLIVQREAVGLTAHQDVERLYALPELESIAFTKKPP